MRHSPPTRKRTSAGLCIHSVFSLLLAVAIIGLGGCRAYQLGSTGLYRPDIRTVHVDIFTSDSYRKFLGQRLTEAVVKQIEQERHRAVEAPEERQQPGAEHLRIVPHPEGRIREPGRKRDEAEGQLANSP